MIKNLPIKDLHIKAQQTRKGKKKFCHYTILILSLTTYINLISLPPHLRRWRGSLTRCRQPGTTWCWCPGGHSQADSVCRRLRQSGCCRRFGRRSRFLVGPALGSAPLGQQRRGNGYGRSLTSRHTLVIYDETSLDFCNSLWNKFMDSVHFSLPLMTDQRELQCCWTDIESGSSASSTQGAVTHPVTQISNTEVMKNNFPRPILDYYSVFPTGQLPPLSKENKKKKHNWGQSLRSRYDLALHSGIAL